MLTSSIGTHIPSIGFGTYKVNGKDGVSTIKAAIDVGYRLFDTAFVYDNERVLGQAIREHITDGKVKREELFVVSKLGPSYHRPEQVLTGCRLSLEQLELDYVDLYLMHTPVASKERCDGNDGTDIDDEVSPLETWKALETCHKQGFARFIGVSNFNEAQLQEIITKGHIKPMVNQVECSLGFQQLKLCKFCKDNDILIMAYSPLGKPKPGKHHPFLELPKLKEISQKYEKSPAQISLRYLIEKGTIPIPKSSNAGRMKENFESLDFSLEEWHIKILETLVEQKRTQHLNWLRASKYYPF